MSDTRLIERWLPIAELGEECDRERRSMTSLPPVYYLHVWWARRPLVASRAAVLASILPEDADRRKFLHVLGIHGDPMAAKRQIEEAKRSSLNLGPNPYGYKRAFSYAPNAAERDWIADEVNAEQAACSILDPTAGGGSIPFETARLGLNPVANDLNAVAGLILAATVDWPQRHGVRVLHEFQDLSERFVQAAEPRFRGIFPEEPADIRIEGYVWARTVACPYCEGLVPLSPNWRLGPGGTGVRLLPAVGEGPGSPGRRCSFEIVESAQEQSMGTVAQGDGTCPFPDCGRVVDSGEIKRQAQAGRMGEQLYAVAFKQRTKTLTKTGKVSEKWIRGYRAPRPEDDNSAEITQRLAEKLPTWEAFDISPTERIPDGTKTSEPIRFGMTKWRDLFSPR